MLGARGAWERLLVREESGVFRALRHFGLYIVFMLALVVVVDPAKGPGIRMIAAAIATVAAVAHVVLTARQLRFRLRAWRSRRGRR